MSGVAASIAKLLGAGRDFADFETATAPLQQWERRYDYERLSAALTGQTPAEKLAAVRLRTARS